MNTEYDMQKYQYNIRVPIWLGGIKKDKYEKRNYRESIKYNVIVKRGRISSS